MNHSVLNTRLVRWVGPLSTLIVASILGSLYGVQLVVLTLAAGALLLVIGLLWQSVQALAGQSELSFEEAFSMGTRTTEEEQKRAVLRALKDLEYERSVGKISEDDYREYSARYRAEAKRLIRDLDENLAEARKRVERELERRLTKLAPGEADESAAPAGSMVSVALDQTSSPEHALPEKPGVKPVRACAACATSNELDARFCKNCGAAIAAIEERSCAACAKRYPQALDECPACGTKFEGNP